MDERRKNAALLLFLQLGDLCVALHENENDEEDDIEYELVLLAAAGNFIKRQPQRIENYVENVVPNYTYQEFQQHFRITVEAYEHLLRAVGPSLQNNNSIGRMQIPAEKQLLAVIWLLATPDSYRSVGERFVLAKSSLSVCFIRVVKVLADLANRILTWPSGERQEEIKRAFFRMAGIHNNVGAIDGTYIVIKAPKEDPQSYVTRKCNFAMTLQAICDHTLKFTDVFVGFPGSVSDTQIFRNSDFYQAVQTRREEFFPNEEFIIGDKAYPILPWCIVPYINRGNLTRAQTSFNTKLAQTRQTIERAFALLFGRFRRLKYLDMNKTNFIPVTVLASCIMHNICLSHDDLLLEEYIREGLPAVLNNDEVDILYQEFQQEGRNKRDQICQLLYHQNGNHE